jgi:hypothetical protein
LRLGLANPWEDFLKRITPKQFFEWQEFFALEPPIDEKIDWFVAAIRHAIYDVWRDRDKHPEAAPLSDYLIELKIRTEEKKEELTEEQKKAAASFIKATALAQARARAKKLKQRKESQEKLRQAREVRRQQREARLAEQRQLRSRKK